MICLHYWQLQIVRQVTFDIAVFPFLCALTLFQSQNLSHQQELALSRHLSKFFEDMVAQGYQSMKSQVLFSHNNQCRLLEYWGEKLWYLIVMMDLLLRLSWQYLF